LFSEFISFLKKVLLSGDLVTHGTGRPKVQQDPDA